MKSLFLITLLLAGLFAARSDGQVSSPVPEDGKIVNELPSAFSWSPVAGVLRYEVFFGEARSAVDAATPDSPQFAGSFTAATFAPPGPGKVSTCYFWRVDAVTTAANLKGPVWRVLTRAPQTAVIGASGAQLPGGAVTVMDGDNAVWANGFSSGFDGPGLTFARRRPGQEVWSVVQKFTVPGAPDSKIESAALSGDRAVAGSQLRMSVYFFVRNPFSGAWELERTIAAPTAAEGFGYSVAAVPGVMASGLPFAAAGSLSNAGAVDIYDPATGVKIVRLQAANPARDAYFGRNIVLSGEWLAVDGGGYIHLFRRSVAGTWTQVTRLPVSYGNSATMTMNGNFLAYSSQPLRIVDLYRFDTAWVKVQSFTEPNPRTQFGTYLSLWQGTLAISEDYFSDADTGTLFKEGRIHLHRRTATETAWHPLAPVRTATGNGSRSLGAISGRWLLTASGSSGLPQSFLINPDAGTAPVFTTLPARFAEAGTPWSYDAIVVPGEHQGNDVRSPRVTFAGPAWLSQSNAGNQVIRFSGTPAAPNTGPVQIELTATGEDGQSAQQIFTLKVVPAGRLPKVLSLSDPQSLTDGQPATLTVEAGGGGPFTYQWMLDGVVIPQATAATLTIPSVQGSDTGSYTVRVSNSDAWTDSAAVMLTVREKLDRFGGDFPTLGRDAARSGYYPATLGPHVWQAKWVTQLMTDSSQFGPFNSQPAIGGGRVFAVETHPSGLGALVALDLRTGVKVWSYPFAVDLGFFTLSPPAYFQGRVYLQRSYGLDDTNLWCFDAATGTLVWKAPFVSQTVYFGSPVVTKDGIWMQGGDTGGLYHFGLDGSQLSFNNTLGQVDRWSPALADGRVFTGTRGFLRAFDADGQEVMKIASDFTGNNYSTNVSVADGIAIMGGASGLMAVNAVSRAKLWSLPVYSDTHAPPARRDGIAYVMNEKNVRAYHAATGVPGLLFDPLLAPFSSESLLNAPIVTDDVLITASENHTCIFRLSDAQLLATLPKGGYVSYADGWLVLAWNGIVSAYYANGPPEFDETMPADYSVDENTPLEIPVSATDLDGDTATLTASPLPRWLELGGGRLRGTPGDFDTGDFTVVLNASDGVVPQPAAKTLRIHVNPVPDPPAVLPLVPVSAGAAGLPVSINIAAGFSDPDSGEVLTYSIVGNTCPLLFSSISVHPQTGVLDVAFAPYISGSADVTIRATGTDGLFADNTILLTLPALPPPSLTLAQNTQINRQTGLREWTVTVTNNAARAIGGFELDFAALPAGAVLYNAGGQRDDGSPFIHYGQPIAPGASVTLILEFHHPARSAAGLPTAVTGQTILPDTPALPGDSSNTLRIDRILPLAGGMLLEFPSQPNRLYEVEYSPDAVAWQSSPVPLRAAGTRTQWIDRGPPRTNSPPNQAGQRFYRVRELLP